MVNISLNYKIMINIYRLNIILTLMKFRERKNKSSRELMKHLKVQSPLIRNRIESLLSKNRSIKPLKILNKGFIR